jgi:hypothetical protein
MLIISASHSEVPGHKSRSEGFLYSLRLVIIFTTSIYLWLYSPLLCLGRFFGFLIFYTVGRIPWTGDQPVARPLPVHRAAQTEKKRTQTSMSQVGFEPTIPVFEKMKTVHALERMTTVTGNFHRLLQEIAGIEP